MGHGEANGGWRVSQVESLLNMSRRDITRSCYADLKRGGAGILQPADGTWGRRNYSIEDIAWLYLVKLQHDQGYSLPEIAKRWIRRPVSARCASIWTPWQIAPPRLMRRRSKGGSVRACCVVRWRCAHVRFTTHSSAICGTASVTRRLKSGEACCGSLCRPSLRTVIPSSSTPKRPDRIRRILDEPGMDLAIELWAGPGAFERLRASRHRLVRRYRIHLIERNAGMTNENGLLAKLMRGKTFAIRKSVVFALIGGILIGRQRIVFPVVQPQRRSEVICV